MKHSFKDYRLFGNSIGEIWIYCDLCTTYTLKILNNGDTIEELLKSIEDHERAMD